MGMSFDYKKNWQPKEWENHVNDLLRSRHGDENYIAIPDEHTGDSGIEGYSLTGIAYQSYAPDELCKPADLYEKQKKKITTDIKKFIDNKEKLSKLIYGTTINRWVLVVPRHVSQELLIHANKKTGEVLAQRLPYVDQGNFMILVMDRECFKVEEQALIEQGIHKLKIEPDHVTPEQIEEFGEHQLEHIDNIVRKLSKLPASTEGKVDAAKSELVKRFITSENILQRLQEDYPQYYEHIQTLRLKREDDLSLEALSNDTPSLEDQVNRFLPSLEDSSKLHSENNMTIAWGSVSDWLMRCPLDFE
jgi:uncharacterized membrane-anchored protein YhcB (DUF1043 family)